MAIGRIPEPGTGIPESIIAAKGDVLTGTANDVPAVITVGANETRLVADSAAATGLKYVADTTNYAVAAKGDLLVGTAADTLAPLTVGTNGHTLVADSATATGLAWAAPASGTTFAGCRIYNSGLLTVPNNTATEITFDSELYDTDGYHSTSTNTSRITVPAGKAGYYLITADAEWGSNASGAREIFIRKNGSLTNGNNAYQNFSSGGFDMKCSHLIYLDVGDYVSLYAFQTSGGDRNFDVTNQYQQFCAIYLGA